MGDDMTYPDDRQYTQDHEWIRISGDTAEIGITDYAQQQLGDIVYVDLPDVGARINAGESFGSIESVKAVSDLLAPMGGEVVDVNAGLKDHPEVVNTDPHAAWMIKVHLANSAEAGALLDSARYGALLK